jgi:hypothetical protein
MITPDQRRQKWTNQRSAKSQSASRRFHRMHRLSPLRAPGGGISSPGIGAAIFHCGFRFGS